MALPLSGEVKEFRFSRFSFVVVKLSYRETLRRRNKKFAQLNGNTHRHNWDIWVDIQKEMWKNIESRLLKHQFFLYVVCVARKMWRNIKLLIRINWVFLVWRFMLWDFHGRFKRWLWKCLFNLNSLLQHQRSAEIRKRESWSLFWIVCCLPFSRLIVKIKYFHAVKTSHNFH